LGSKIDLPRGVRSKREGVEHSTCSGKVEHFSFSMFHDKAKLCKKSRNYIITIEKVSVRN